MLRHLSIAALVVASCLGVCRTPAAQVSVGLLGYEAIQKEFKIEEGLKSVLQPRQPERPKQLTVQSYMRNIHLQVIPSQTSETVGDDGSAEKTSGGNAVGAVAAFRKARTREDRLAFGNQVVASRAEMTKNAHRRATRKTETAKGRGI